MNDIVVIVLVVVAATLIATPWLIARHLERIQSQNERIISLLVDIKKELQPRR